ncbi:MAG: type II toxin-antitoxin system HipA family toxin [Verrucomicrobiae bacterium]|nr:type II toxin-antitoxin system HipA family toxin [Verrucomicrobiae bacterium]
MILNVYYDNESLVGKLAEDPGHAGLHFFEYDSGWIARKLDLSPFRLPLQLGLLAHRNPDFFNLPGLFYDSLPDAWGVSVLEQYFRQMGKTPEEITPLMRLAYIGSRGVGALSYQPAMEIADDHAHVTALDLAKMDRESHKILIGRAQTVLPELAAGSSAGGQRPKIWAAMKGDQVVHGAAVIPEGFTGYLIKLAALRPGAMDTGQYGRLEYAYSLMGRAARINLPATRLVSIRQKNQEIGLFATERFDRIHKKSGWQRVHVQSLASLLHLDFNQTVDAADYLGATWRLTQDVKQTAEAFRRIVFNVASCNCDDHSKNFAFMMNEQGQWSLTPAYDLTYSLGQGRNGVHAMSVNGSRKPGCDDLLADAGKFEVEKAGIIIDEVCDAVGSWPDFAKKAGVATMKAREINDRILEFGLKRGRRQRQGGRRPMRP